MGNYRQHIAFASTLGVGYGVAAYALAGLHWLYGSVALLFATLGGLLPDLDSPSGVELKSFTGILGVIGALVVWMEVGRIHPPPVFELQLWAMVGTYLMIRHGLRRVMGHLTVHRGISHSFPTLAVWAELTYLHYPTESHAVRIMMGMAVGLGFFSHLLLDEICSVDLKGVRLNKAFGTAMKFWAPSIGSTLAIYGLLSFLTWQIIRQWPDEPFANEPTLRVPEWPATWPRIRLPDSWWRAIGEVEAKSGLKMEVSKGPLDSRPGSIPRVEPDPADRPKPTGPEPPGAGRDHRLFKPRR